MSAEATRGRSPIRLIDLRWGLLLPFVIPFVDVESPFFLAAPTVLGLSTISAIACGFLLSRLGGPARRSLWAWVILLLFLQGYFVKSFWFARVVQTPNFMLVNHELYWLSADQIAEGLTPITWAFSTFCVVAWVLLGPVPPPSIPDGAAEGTAAQDTRALWLIGLATLLAFLLGMVQAYLGFGVMGVDTDSLPMKLDTVIVRTRTELVPGLIYLGLTLVDRSPRRRTWLLAMAPLLALAGLDTLISTSRGSFVRFGLPVLFLWLIMGRLTARRAAFIGMTLGLTLALHPVITILRAQRMSDSTGVASAAGVDELDVSTGSPLYTVGVVASRVSGAEGVWYAAGELDEGIDLERIGDHLSGRLPIHVHYTRSIVG